MLVRRIREEELGDVLALLSPRSVLRLRVDLWTGRYCEERRRRSVFAQRSSTLKAFGCVCLAWQQHYGAFNQQERSQILFGLFASVYSVGLSVVKSVGSVARLEQCPSSALRLGGDPTINEKNGAV